MQAPPPPAPPRPEPRKVQSVPLESVKSLLRSDLAASVENATSYTSRFLEKLADGENDPFLQQLLMMEYMRGVSEEDSLADSLASAHISSRQGGRNGSDQPQVEDLKSESWKTNFACERVKLLLSKVELAYDSLEAMLPARASKASDVRQDGSFRESLSFDSNGEDDIEAPQVVPDLLPPCTSRQGDPTLEFFRACMGEALPGDIGSEDIFSGGRDTTDPHDDNLHPHHRPHDGLDDTTTDASSDMDDSVTASSNTSATAANTGTLQSSSSMFSGMFNMRRPAFRTKAISHVFGKKRRGKTGGSSIGTDDLSSPFDVNASQCEPGEYTVTIEREMLGLTVENVLERTVVRTVLAGGPAKKAGAQVGSLIVKVGNIETKNLTHFETIDELRQSQRPLQLVLRHISDDALRSAREEMGRLIRGSGFGRIIDGEVPLPPPPQDGATKQMEDGPDGRHVPPAIDRNIELYSNIVRKRWIDAVNLAPRSKKDEPILRVGEKIIWIMTLFVVGLEREAERHLALANAEEEWNSSSRHSQYHHSGKDYADAAKSASKILFDFVCKRMDPLRTTSPDQQLNGGPHVGGRHGVRGSPMGGRGGRGGGRGQRGGRGPGIPGMGDVHNSTVDDASSERLLLQIGDVLQRMRTFLADPTSPPAALVRGELIGCLCDILDADTEMKLSEEDSVSSTQGARAGPITDLGSAGSLLKLIVLNCPIMRSPACEEMSVEERHIDEDELKRRFGERKAFSANDYHRLHAGNRFLAVVHRLAASRSTSARITACSLGPVLWSHLDFPHQLQVSIVVASLGKLSSNWSEFTNTPFFPF